MSKLLKEDIIKTMSKIVTDQDRIQKLLTRAVEKIYPSPEFLEQKLKSGKQLSVYYGVDPTGPDLHLGHSVQLLSLKKFQELGHKTILLIGDFTAQIGDPSGRDSGRRQLSEEEVKENEKNYKDQIAKILDLNKTEIRHNSEWLGKLNFGDILKLASLKTVQQLLDREMFQRRIEKGESIGVHEFMYPLMQGYDSVALEIDGEIGGNDQTFNMLVGRDLEKDYLQKEKFVLATRLLVNPLTGKKMMSKSEGDYVSLRDKPENMYAKILALPDETVFEVFELCTEVSLEKINDLKSVGILKAKHELAFEITKIYHGQEAANEAKEEFEKVFSKKQLPSDIKEFKPGSGRESMKDVLFDSKLIESKSEIKRLLDQKAIRINNVVIEELDYQVKKGDIIQIGPKRFIKIG